jgi:hypothetical protein
MSEEMKKLNEHIKQKRLEARHLLENDAGWSELKQSFANAELQSQLAYAWMRLAYGNASSAMNVLFKYGNHPLMSDLRQAVLDFHSGKSLRQCAQERDAAHIEWLSTRASDEQQSTAIQVNFSLEACAPRASGFVGADWVKVGQ